MKYNRNIFEECVSSFQDDSFTQENLIYTKYISDNKNIVDLVSYILSNKGTFLIQAAPGGGKTTTLIDIANKIGEPIAILNPTRILVCQVYKENKNKSKMARVIGAKGGKIEAIDKNAIVYSCSYEMLINLVKDNLVKKVIVDEAHNLVLAKYRDFKNLEETLKKMDTVIYCTATPNSLMNRKLDMYINLKKEVENSYANNNQIYFSNSKDNNIDNIYALIVKNKNLGFKTLIRVNDSTGIEDIISKAKENNIKGMFINSTQKSFDVIDDEEIFENPMMDGLVNHSCLIDNIDGEEVDFWISTCIIDQGVNIKNVCSVKTNKENNKLREYTYSSDLSNVRSIFVANSSEELNIDYILQYKDRLRDTYDEFGILLKAQEKTYSIGDYLDFYNKSKKSVVRYLEFITNWIEDNKEENVLALWEEAKNNKDMLSGILNDYNGAIKVIKENDEYKAIIYEDIFSYNTLMEYYKRFYNEFNEDIYLDVCNLNIIHDTKAKMEVIKKNIEESLPGAFNLTIKGKEAKEVKQKFKQLIRCGYMIEEAKTMLKDNLEELENVDTIVENSLYEDLNKLDNNTLKELTNEIKNNDRTKHDRLMSKLEMCNDIQEALTIFVEKDYDLDFFKRNLGKAKNINEYLENKRIEDILEANTKGKRDLLPDAQSIYNIIDKIALKKGDKLRLYTLNKNKTKVYTDASKRIQDAYEQLKGEYPKIKTYKNFCKLVQICIVSPK